VPTQMSNLAIKFCNRALAYAVAILLLSVSQAQANCAEAERTSWPPGKKLGLSLEAYAVGTVCDKAAIVLLVTNKDREVVYSFVGYAKEMAWFQEGVGDGPAMKLGLKNWLVSASSGPEKSTADLPDWKDGAEAPSREGDGEFGFYANEGVDRSYYLEKRKLDLPMLCFVSGVESTTCLIAASKNSIIKIGGFTFPG
jgi:hypothetical protein